MTHPNLKGLDIPKGWEWAEEQLPEPTLAWPQYQLEAVIAAEKVERRKTLFPRFQLFDTTGGEFHAIIRTADFSDFLRAFKNAAAQRRKAAAE